MDAERDAGRRLPAYYTAVETSSKSWPWGWPIAVILVATIGVLDHATGVAIRIYPLYFLPIALGAWSTPRLRGVFVPLLATISWIISNQPEGEHAADRMVWATNACMQAVAFLTVGILLSQLRIRLDREQQLSRSDTLTGLPNSRAFHEYGETLLAGTVRAHQPVTLAYLDLDNFKAVNDAHGHLEGDRVLRRVATVLREQLRKSDVAARLGGDEFAIILPNTGGTGAHAILERLRSAVLSEMDAAGWPVSVSIGAVTYARAPASFQDALKQADGLMYASKREGKDRLLIEERPRPRKPAPAPLVAAPDPLETAPSAEPSTTAREA